MPPQCHLNAMAWQGKSWQGIGTYRTCLLGGAPIAMPPILMPQHGNPAAMALGRHGMAIHSKALGQHCLAAPVPCHGIGMALGAAMYGME
jgi:hypothetical protein